MTQLGLPNLYEIPVNKCCQGSGQRRLDALRDVVIPASHRDDPQSSKEAEERVTASGLRGAHARQVLRDLCFYNNSTARELEFMYGCPQTRGECYSVTEYRRRLYDLMMRGFVKQGEKRKCRIAETNAVVWYVTDAGRAANE